ncbi:MAG: menaquinone biosynthesis protein [Bacteroidia bacterium]|nr:menaquinone biosynthesis protein [Bacteroidia bacterium]
MAQKKISVVSYTNSKPFLLGLEKYKNDLDINISLDNPAECAMKLRSASASIGLVPVYAMKDIPNAAIISDYGIAAKGSVSSVLLVSDVPLESIRQIYLDYQSRTSVALLKILACEFWNINVKYLDAMIGFEDRVRSNTAALIIGDRALEYRKKYKFTYDLSQEWYNYTSLPFVFARWVSISAFTEDFEKQFNAALKYGVENRMDILNEQRKLSLFNKDLITDYINNKIKYYIDDEMRSGMELFLQKSENLSAVPQD